MTGGYAGRFLDVDLTTGRIDVIRFDDDVLAKYVGGRGLAAKVLWDRLGEKWEKIDPLGPENIFVAFTGPLTGFYPGARICVSGKSPQSCGIIGSTSSGEFPSELKCCGYDGVIVSGKAEKPVYIEIIDEHVEIKGAEEIWGKDGEETVLWLVKRTRDAAKKMKPGFGEIRDPGMIYLGPAGENLVRTASVMQKWTHSCGYGGYGAVMGSKNLKAIVAKGFKPLPEVADMKRMLKLRDQVINKLLTYDSMRRWGTGSGGYWVGVELSSEPVRNWQEEWHDERSFGVPSFDFRFWVKRYWSDFGCPMTCMKLAVIKSGRFKGDITDMPDYEMQAYLGTNLGIFTAEGAVHLSALCDNLGLCGIQTGNVLGFAAELYQRGILTAEELGLELKWGDVDAFDALIRKIVKREGIGDILAEGTYRAARKLSEIKGVDLTKYAVQVKGVALGAHGTRSSLDFQPIAYAVNVQCGDHTSAVYDACSDMDMVFADSAVLCSINGWRVGYELVWEFARAVTGWSTTRDEWNTRLSRRIMHIQRAALLLAGPDVKWDPNRDDDNPPRFYEPLPSGPYKGEATDRAEVEERKRQFYEAMGWDERGIPKSSVLRELGLESVDRALEKLRI